MRARAVAASRRCVKGQLFEGQRTGAAMKGAAYREAAFERPALDHYHSKIKSIPGRVMDDRGLAETERYTLQSAAKMSSSP